MAWRRLASGAAMAAHLRRGVPSPHFAPARTFSALCGPAAASPTPPARHALQGIWSRCSSSPPASQVRAPVFRALLAARVSPGVRPKLPGLLRGFGTGGTAIAVMLYPTKVVEAQERPPKSPSKDITVLSPYSKQVLRKFWNFVRKFQLPIGLILLIVYGWRKPMVLAINTLLLLYSTRPDPYSIYLFLQEIHQGKVQQNPALWKEEVIQTRKVDTEDYKFFSIGTVELKDRTVLHVIGILGNWWIYHVSYDKRVEQLYLKMGGRNIGVAVDFSSCSKAALRWASTNLARRGDQLVLIHVNNSYQNEQGAMHLWEQSGSPLIPLVEFSDPHVTKKYGLSPDKETLEILAQVAHQSGVEVFGKIFYGDPTKKLCEAIDLVPLSCLVIGSRGLSTLKRALMGSVSTYVVNHAACPVTVVKENM